MKIKIFLIFMTSFLLFGCGGEEKTVVNESAADYLSESQSYSFIFVCPIVENEYWQNCINGIKKADKELGTNTIVMGSNDAANFSTEIIDYMKKAIELKPDGIMAYAGIEGMFPLIDQAYDEGIPFIAIDSDAPETKRAAYVGIDSYNSGYQAGETMVKLTNGKAKIGILVSSLSAEKEMEVLNAFRDSISDYDMEIIAIEETNGELDVAVEKTKAMLSEHPEITAMFNTGGYNVTGAARVKKEQGLSNLILMGFDDVEENLNFVHEGVINVLIAQDPEYMGYKGVYLMKEYIDIGKLSKENFDTGIIMITKENIDNYKK